MHFDWGSLQEVQKLICTDCQKKHTGIVCAWGPGVLIPVPLAYHSEAYATIRGASPDIIEPDVFALVTKGVSTVSTGIVA
jgi:hypothetical protein